MAHEIYWEKQRSPDLCRLYAINAFYGENYINQAQFREFCLMYNKEYPDCVVPTSATPGHIDSIVYYNVPSNNITLIHYILGFTGIKCEYVPPKNSGNSSMHLNVLLSTNNISIEEFIGDSEWIFLFDQGHTWGMKKLNGEWYKVDSLSGVSRTSLNSIQSTDGKYGLIIPRSKRDLIKILVRYKKFIKEYVDKNNISTLSIFQDFIHSQRKRGYPIGDLEIPIFVYAELISGISLKDDKICSLYKTIKEKMARQEDLSYELYIIVNSIIMHEL